MAKRFDNRVLLLYTLNHHAHMLRLNDDADSLGAFYFAD